MGVKGFATYIGDHQDLLDLHELHGGYVIIDGESLAIELYKNSTQSSCRNVHCNCAFGGDYNKYARCVTDFFNSLEKCKVTPLVLFDGGMEKKKMETLFGRREKKLRKSLTYTLAHQRRQMMLPANAILTFKTCLAQRQTKIARCVFENDPGVAGVAKILDCPVLSLDTDFYIFGVKYIPLDSLGSVVAMNGGKNVMRCKMFNPGNLLKLFPNLDCSALPLLAVLMGNDYIKGTIFQNFFNCLGLSNVIENQHVIKINAILAWLSGRKLDCAVAAILSTLPVKHRRRVLDIIELIVNGYHVLPFDMLEPLGLAHEYRRVIAIITDLQRRFTFQGNINNLKPTSFWRHDEININPNLDYDETELPFDMQKNVGSDGITFVDTLPPWFKHDYASAKLMSNFVTMMFNRLYVFTVQMEDPEKPCAELISLNLIRIIDGLLVAGRAEAGRNLTYVLRDGTQLVSRQAITVRGINSMDFPALSELGATPLSLRKRIFDDALEMSREKTKLLEDFPSQWRVPIATIWYWIDPIDAAPPTDVHLYSLLFAMLLGEVDKAIAEVNYQPLKKSNKKFKKLAREIRYVPKTKSDSIIQALEAITASDCLKVADFFISNYEVDRTLLKKPNALDVTILHAFSQFQGCLKHTIGLNALLGCPYEFPVIAEFYNGTMLYNLYIQFEKCANVEMYMAEVLADAPSLLRLLNLLISKMKMLIDTPLGTKRSKQKAKSNMKKGNNNYYEECNQSSEDSESECFDEYELVKAYTPKAKELLCTDMAVNQEKGAVKRKK